MYLSDAIVDRSGQRHALAGLIPGVATMQDKLQALGYVEVQTRTDTLLGPAGTRFRGHQFRYSRFDTQTPPRAFRVEAARSGTADIEGYATGSVLGTYVHAHWASNPAIAHAFVAACRPHPPAAPNRRE
jgi:cobyrinic acid a,c-diamide synthase